MKTEPLLKVAWVLFGALFGTALGTVFAPDETQLRYVLALLFRHHGLATGQVRKPVMTWGARWLGESRGLEHTGC